MSLATVLKKTEGKVKVRPDRLRGIEIIETTGDGAGWWQCR